MGTLSRSGVTQIDHTQNEFTFAVYNVSINDNYVMGRDGRGSKISLEPHEVRKHVVCKTETNLQNTCKRKNGWLIVQQAQSTLNANESLN